MEYTKPAGRTKFSGYGFSEMYMNLMLYDYSTKESSPPKKGSAMTGLTTGKQIRHLPCF
jgi:hypothetical protein